MAKIRHIAIWTDDPERLATYYCDVFGLTRKLDNVRGGPDEDNYAIFITDGYMEVAIIKPNSDQKRRGLNHFGFTLDPGEKDEIYGRMSALGRPPRKAPAARPYVEDAGFDPDGNKFDLSSTGLRVPPS
jgi:catechol 2,3-dioxygenase-like lactoylglutathione lyase family enzyme